MTISEEAAPLSPAEIQVPVFTIGPTGGVERFTWHVGEELAKRGHHVVFLAPGSDVQAPEGTDRRSIGRRVPRSRRAVSANVVTFGARVTARRVRGRPIWYGPVGSHFHRGVVTAHAVHAADVRRRGPGAAPLTVFDRAFMQIERFTYHRTAAAVTAVSPSVADELAAAYGLDRAAIAVTPPGIDNEEFTPVGREERRAARRRRGLAEEFVVGVTANYGFTGKNVAGLVEAVSALGATLLVAGVDEKAQPGIARLAAERRADVRFLGSVSDMQDYYAALDVYAQPSFYEAFGMAAMEAMACGLPVVVGERCGIAGVARPGIELWVADPHDERSLVEVLGLLRDDPAQRRSLTAAGMAWARSRPWSDVARDIEGCLARVAEPDLRSG